MIPGGYRDVWRVAFPLILSMGSYTIMQFCDRMFLSWHSEVSIQAALPAGMMAFAFVSGFHALTSYANTFVAQYYGKGNLCGCARSTAQGVFLALCSWPLILLLIPAGQWLLRASGHPAEVLEQELVYFRILMVGSLPVLLHVAFSSFFSGRGDTRTVMIAHLAGNMLNIVLDYVLIFGKFGFPRLGIAGAGYATVLSGTLVAVVLASLYFSRRIDLTCATRRSLLPEWVLLKRFLHFGIPASLHTIIDVSSFTLFVLLMGRLESIQVTVNNIAFSINHLAFAPLLGLNHATAILVGQYQGKRQSDIAEKTVWTTMRIGFIYMGIMGAGFVLIPEFFFGLFARNSTGPSLQEMMPLARPLLIMMAIWGLFDVVGLVLTGALKGSGDTRFIMIFMLLAGWVIWIGGQVAWMHFFDIGVIYSFAWLTFYVMVLAIGFFWRFRSGYWKCIDVIEPDVTVPLEP
jgi:multidrug resistance protein, MATE family